MPIYHQIPGRKKSRKTRCALWACAIWLFAQENRACHAAHGQGTVYYIQANCTRWETSVDIDPQYLINFVLVEPSFLVINSD